MNHFFFRLFRNFERVFNSIRAKAFISSSVLAAKGHRRAKFDLENNKDTWLIP